MKNWDNVVLVPEFDEQATCTGMDRTICLISEKTILKSVISCIKIFDIADSEKLEFFPE